MPQFAPGEVKSARAPITVKPSGLSCSAELYLVSNGAKVATSGIKLFTSTGAKQDVSLPITMPGAEGVYPVYLDIFTNGLLIGAYKAVEDVVITSLIIITRHGLQILDISGKKFIEVGVDPDGKPYGVLSEPVHEVSTYATDVHGFNIHWRVPYEYPFKYTGKLRFIGRLACEGCVLSYIEGWSGKIAGKTGILEGTTRCIGPYHDTCSVKGMCSASIRWEFYEYEDGYRDLPRFKGSFSVKNMLRIT